MIVVPGWLVGVFGTLMIEFVLLVIYSIWKGSK